MAPSRPESSRLNAPDNVAPSCRSRTCPAQALFPVDREPFYAGFGHSASDAQAYRAVSVPRGRIFTIDKNSNIRHSDRVTALPESYASIADLADVMFPPFEADGSPKLDAAAEFNAVNFWREPFLF